MPHAPTDPVVREAYQNLIRQTRAQYDALVEDGYSFWFMDLNREDNQAYANSPWNAMRDIRANKTMGVFPTRDGFGTQDDFSPDANPLLEDVGLMWSVGEPGSETMAPVTANDLFRAVHDAFGHGLEGSGFRARGEENAWQAHARLFTGSALGALTSETRGQNSWLNYGPHGQSNQTAKVEDTIFADQKTGLMPEWTWLEGIAEDAEVDQDAAAQDQAIEQTETPEFRAWFGDSKVVDGQGKPLVVYHGTAGDFDVFDASRSGENYRSTGGQVGFFFTSNPGTASVYAEKPAGAFLDPSEPGAAEFGDGTANIMPVYLSLQNPIIVNTKDGADKHFDYNRSRLYERARKAGADGIIINGSNRSIFVALDPTQIKSAIGNQGAFDPADPNILNQDEQQPRGQISLADDITQSPSVITLFLGADLSTMLHEMGHFFLEVQLDLASKVSGDAGFNEGAGEGERQLLADTQALMQWFGLESIDQWYTLPADERVAYHEQFARGFEAYLFEGNAPNVDVQSIFQRFRAWLLKIYQDIKALNVELDDEVRGVMDRMLASQEQIEVAQMARSMQPLFASPEQAGMTAQEFAAYQALGDQATATAQDELQGKALRDMAFSRNARNREIKRLQKELAEERRQVRQDVRRDVLSRPEYQAWTFLAGTNPNGPKGGNKLAVNPANPNVTPEEWAALTKLRMTDPAGMDVDMAADVVPGLAGQFTSGDQLVRAILAAEPPNELIERLTDQAMHERFGELTTEEGIARAADEAVYNDLRTRVISAEHNAIARATGKPKILEKAAKAMADAMIGRLTFANIRPHLYAAAGARAGRAAAKAMKAGDLETTATEKRNQLINAHAAVAAKDAIAEVKAAMKIFKAVQRGTDKKTVSRGLDPDVLNAARQILGAYGIGERAAEKATNYIEVLSRNNPEMYKILEPSIQAGMAMAKPVGEMTLEEIRGLRDEIQAMVHLAKRSRTMEVGGNLLDREEVLAELQGRMIEIGVPDTIPGETSAITPMEAALQKLQYGKALLGRVEQWSEAKDGKFGGPFLRYIFQPIKEAADRFRLDRTAYRKQYLELVQAIAPSMRSNRVIEAPELGYTFGKGHNGIGVAELLHAILHTGNESNKRKLLLGRNWATELPDGTLDTRKWDAFVNRMHEQGTLTKAHYDFAQGVWDLMESMKPMAQKAHRDVFGRYFEEVTADEFSTPFGVYRGGYVPAQADPRIVKDAALRGLAEEENQNMAYSFPSTSKGFTKSRVEYNRPLMLDLRSLSQHIDKVLLFSHMEPAVRDVNRLITDKDFSATLTRIEPAVIDGMLVPWLKRSATQQVETPIIGDGNISRVLSVIRSRAGMALMFGNISNTLQQITGLPGAMNKVRGGLLMKSMASYLADPKGTAETVAEASIFMRDRMTNEIAAIQNQMSDILLDPSAYEKAQAWTMKHAYFAQVAMDNVIGPVVWTGAYNQAVEDGMTTEDAVRFADGVIRQTQNTTLAEDVSRIETGPAYARLFTQFLGYFNMMANTNAAELSKIAKGVGMRKGAGKAIGIIFWGLMVPAWLAEAIAIAMRGGPEDEDDDGYLDDWIMEVVGMGTLKFALAGVPFVGQFANAGINRFNNNPVDDRVSLSPGVSLLEGSVGAPYSVYKALVDEGSKAKAVKDVGTAVSLMTGLPAHWAARPISYWVGVADDRIEPEGFTDALRGTLTGVASPDSRVR
jgi:hypothetical protein